MEQRRIARAYAAINGNKSLTSVFTDRAMRLFEDNVRSYGVALETANLMVATMPEWADSACRHRWVQEINDLRCAACQERRPVYSTGV